MEFSVQEYWSGLPFSPPGDRPTLGIEPMSPELAGRFLTTEPPGKPRFKEKCIDVLGFPDGAGGKDPCLPMQET